MFDPITDVEYYEHSSTYPMNERTKKRMASAFQRANKAFDAANEMFEAANEMFDSTQTDYSKSTEPMQTIRFMACGAKRRFQLMFFFLQQAFNILFKGKTEFKFKAK